VPPLANLENFIYPHSRHSLLPPLPHAQPSPPHGCSRVPLFSGSAQGAPSPPMVSSPSSQRARAGRPFFLPLLGSKHLPWPPSPQPWHPNPFFPLLGASHGVPFSPLGRGFLCSLLHGAKFFFSREFLPMALPPCRSPAASPWPALPVLLPMRAPANLHSRSTSPCSMPTSPAASSAPMASSPPAASSSLALPSDVAATTLLPRRAASSTADLHSKSRAAAAPFFALRRRRASPLSSP
jgi:hypothetical protein